MKIYGTMRVLFKVFCARTFGTYKHSVWDGTTDYSVYQWRGNTFYLPPVYFDNEITETKK